MPHSFTCTCSIDKLLIASVWLCPFIASKTDRLVVLHTKPQSTKLTGQTLAAWPDAATVAADDDYDDDDACKISILTSLKSHFGMYMSFELVVFVRCFFRCDFCRMNFDLILEISSFSHNRLQHAQCTRRATCRRRRWRRTCIKMMSEMKNHTWKCIWIASTKANTARDSCNKNHGCHSHCNSCIQSALFFAIIIIIISRLDDSLRFLIETIRTRPISVCLYMCSSFLDQKKFKRRKKNENETFLAIRMNQTDSKGIQ